jgi:putative transposase
MLLFIPSRGAAMRPQAHGRSADNGLKTDQVKRLKEIEQENTRLRRAISDLTLDKLILQEATRGNF